MAAQNIKIWKKFRIKILQVPETKAQWKKHTPKRKGDTLETRFSKKKKKQLHSGPQVKKNQSKKFYNWLQVEAKEKKM